MAEGRFERFSGTPDPGPRVPVEHGTPAADQGGQIPDWVSRIPEQYRENPAGYFDHVSELETQARDAQTWREYGTQAQTYITWAQDQLARRSDPGQGQIPTTPQPQQPRWSQPPSPVEGVDWEDPDTIPQVSQQMWDRLSEQNRELQNRIDFMQNDIEQRSEAIQNLFSYYDRLNRIEQQGLYEHNNYTPPVTREQIADYMRHNPGVTPEQAQGVLSEGQRIEAARQRGMEEGRREAARERANGRIVGETSRGTPPRRPAVQDNPHRGYRTHPQALYDRVSERLGRSDW